MQKFIIQIRTCRLLPITDEYRYHHSNNKTCIGHRHKAMILLPYTISRTTNSICINVLLKVLRTLCRHNLPLRRRRKNTIVTVLMNLDVSRQVFFNKLYKFKCFSMFFYDWFSLHKKTYFNTITNKYKIKYYFSGATLLWLVFNSR